MGWTEWRRTIIARHFQRAERKPGWGRLASGLAHGVQKGECANVVAVSLVVEVVVTTVCYSAEWWGAPKWGAPKKRRSYLARDVALKNRYIRSGKWMGKLSPRYCRNVSDMVLKHGI